MVDPALVELDWIALSLFWKAWTVEVMSSLLSSLMAIYVMGLCILFIKMDIVLDSDLWFYDVTNMFNFRCNKIKFYISMYYLLSILL